MMEKENVIFENEEKTPLKINIGNEPDFIKLYIDHLFYFKELNYDIDEQNIKGCTQKAMMVLFAIVGQMTYANPCQPFGGMTVDMTKGMKEFIAQKTNVKPNTIDKYLKTFTDADILRRVERGKYQANPRLFGKGEWKDIKDIAVTYDYRNGNMKPTIE